MKEEILFSIIVPTYNRAGFILKTIDSFIAQQYSNFEMIIVDDGSTDNTKEVVATISDARIRYHLKQNGERGAARNYGAALAQGDYVNYFDSDDFSYPNHLSAAYDIIKKKPQSIFHTGYNVLVEEETVRSVTDAGSLNKKLIEGNLLSCNNVFIPASIAKENKFSENRALSGSEDYLLWLQLTARYEMTGYSEITTAVVHHDGRSMSWVDGNNTIKRVNILFDELAADPIFMKNSGSKLNIIKASCYLLGALDFSMGKQKKNAIKYLTKSVIKNIRLAFSKRVLVVIRNIVFR